MSENPIDLSVLGVTTEQALAGAAEMAEDMRDQTRRWYGPVPERVEVSYDTDAQFEPLGWDVSTTATPEDASAAVEEWMRSRES